MNFKEVNLSTKCSEPEMSGYLHKYGHNHLPNALRKFSIDLLGGKNWNTKSFRKIDQLFKLNVPKFQKELSTNNISHKGSLLFFKRHFAFGRLEGREAISTGCDNVCAKNKNKPCSECARNMMMVKP